MKKISKRLLSVLLVFIMLVPTCAMTIMSNAETISDDVVEFNGHYYKVFDEGLSWSDARRACENAGGYLVTITSQEEQEFLIDLVKDLSKLNVWIGADKKNGKIELITDEDFSLYTNWAAGEPNNPRNQEVAVMMYVNSPDFPVGTWNDEYYTGGGCRGYYLSDFGYVCEWDSAENIGAIPDDAVEFNGHYYKVYEDSLSWLSAKSACDNAGGHLVTINSQEEQEFLLELVKGFSKMNVWIGADKHGDEFEWVTDEDFSLYTNWAKGEPNNVRNEENAVMMYVNSPDFPAGTWNDEDYDGENIRGYALSDTGYVCEWDNEENAVTIPDDVVEFNGNLYRIFNDNLTWEEAKEYCESMGGHLLAVNTDDENEFIVNLLNESSQMNCYWIGVQYSYDKQTWVLVTGEPTEWFNWAPNEPNNYEDKAEAYVHLFGCVYTEGKGIKEVGQWNDVAKDGASYAAGFYALSNFGFICEWEKDVDVTPLRGDVNHDGKVTAADARIVLRTASQLQTLNEADSEIADVTLDGKITAADARIILRIASKLE